MFEITIVTAYEDFKPVMKLEWEAYSDSVNSIVESVKGDSIEECTARGWKKHESTPGSFWIKATDTATGELVGAAQWIIHEQNPYRNYPPPPWSPSAIPWWSSSEKQDITRQLITKFHAPVPGMMNRPHAELYVLFVKLEARRHGVGKALTAWGLRKADAMNLESFVQASPMGADLYPLFGFVTVSYIDITAENDDPTPEWTAWYKQIVPQPFRVDNMWRPPQGRFDLEKPFYPWQSQNKAATVNGNHV